MTHITNICFRVKLMLRFMAFCFSRDGRTQKMKKAGRSHLKTSPPGIPSAFLDPISGEIMRDPVTTIDGRSYERSSIEAWLACGNRISPITKLFLSRTTILPNTALKKAIDSFLAETKKTEAAQVPTTGKHDPIRYS